MSVPVLSKTTLRTRSSAIEQIARAHEETDAAQARLDQLVGRGAAAMPIAHGQVTTSSDDRDVQSAPARARQPEGEADAGEDEDGEHPAARQPVPEPEVPGPPARSRVC